MEKKGTTCCTPSGKAILSLIPTLLPHLPTLFPQASRSNPLFSVAEEDHSDDKGRKTTRSSSGRGAHESLKGALHLTDTIQPKAHPEAVHFFETGSTDNWNGRLGLQWIDVRGNLTRQNPKGLRELVDFWYEENTKPWIICESVPGRSFTDPRLFFFPLPMLRL